MFGGGYETWGIPEVQNKFEVERPEQVIDFLGMMGDSSDNIPGLPGVGEKTAKKFLAAYGSMEGLLANTHELKGKMKEKVEAAKDLGILSKQLATIILDVPVEFHFDDFELSQPDTQAVGFSEFPEQLQVGIIRWIKYPKHQRQCILGDGNLNLRQPVADRQVADEVA